LTEPCRCLVFVKSVSNPQVLPVCGVSPGQPAYESMVEVVG
jgi:hypothetical protein